MSQFQRLSAAFDDLLALEPTARQQRLADLQRDTPALADELVRMLDEYENEHSRPLADAATRLGLPADAREPIPDSIADWAIEGELGRGGMGVVLAARRSREGVTQSAALKWLKRGLDTDAMLDRFRRERRILAALDHPHIARFIEGGSHEGRPWFAMERADGLPITLHAREQGLDLVDRLALLRDVCDAVDHAHRRLVLHRDIKPSNVFVTHQGRVMLLDFGIAKLLGDTDGAATETAARVLTPAYAAPEQLQGEPVSTATDIHALGLLAFEVLAEAPPQGRPTAPDAPLLPPSAPLLQTQRYPSGVSARSWCADLDAVLARCTAVQPAARYATVRELAADLAALAEGRPVSARRPGAWQAARAFVRRHRLAVWTTAAALLSLSFGLSLAMWQAQRAGEEALRAEAARVEAERQARRAQLSSHFFSASLGRIGDLVLTKGRDVSALDWIESALGKLDDELKEDPAASALVRGALGNALLSIGVPDRARDALQRAIPDLASDSEADRDARVAALSALAQALNKLGEQVDAGEALDRALGEHATLPLNDARRATALAMRTALASIRNQQGRYEEGLALSRQNLPDREALFGRGAIQTAVDHYNIGVSCNLVGDSGCALAAFDAAEAAIRAAPSPPLARLAWVETGRATSLRATGDLEAAAAAVVRASEVAHRFFKPPQEIHAIILLARAQVDHQAGRREDALAALAEAEAMMRPLGMAYLSRVLQMQARMAGEVGDWARMGALLDEVLAMRPVQADSTDLTALQWRALDGLRRVRQGDRDGGLSRLRAADAALRAHPRHPAEDAALIRRLLREAESAPG